MNTELRFTDLPTKHQRRRTFDWDAIYTELRDHPAQWALISERGNISTYNAIKQGKIKNFNPKIGVEVKTANNDFTVSPRTCDLYARYNPDLDEALTMKECEKVWRKVRRAEREKKMTVSTVETEDA